VRDAPRGQLQDNAPDRTVPCAAKRSDRVEIGVTNPPLARPTHTMALRCRTVVARLPEYQDGAGTRFARACIRLHLACCHHCSAYLGKMQAVRSALAAMGLPSEPDGETKARLLERFRAWRDSKQG
jgi:hypothetical protein